MLENIDKENKLYEDITDYVRSGYGPIYHFDSKRNIIISDTKLYPFMIDRIYLDSIKRAYIVVLELSFRNKIIMCSDIDTFIRDKKLDNIFSND